MTSFTAHSTCQPVATPKPRGLLRSLMSWPALARQRRALATLDDHMLQDIGITRAAAQQEASRPVWDQPEN